MVPGLDSLMHARILGRSDCNNASGSPGYVSRPVRLDPAGAFAIGPPSGSDSQADDGSRPVVGDFRNDSASLDAILTPRNARNAMPALSRRSLSHERAAVTRPPPPERDR